METEAGGRAVDISYSYSDVYGDLFKAQIICIGERGGRPFRFDLAQHAEHLEGRRIVSTDLSWLRGRPHEEQRTLVDDFKYGSRDSSARPPGDRYITLPMTRYAAAAVHKIPSLIVDALMMPESFMPPGHTYYVPVAVVPHAEGENRMALLLQYEAIGNAALELDKALYGGLHRLSNSTPVPPVLATP
ncbi:MAG TPA: hypothetical protein VLI54_04405 [Bacillota bacterium]|nr:hypothetical protein [Bacillota bacterium]